MNIAIVSPAPPFRGGISDHTKGLYNYLSKKNSVKIFSFYNQYPKFFFPGTNQKSVNKKFKNTNYSISSVNPISWQKTSNSILKFSPDIVIFSYWQPFFAPCYGYTARFLKYRIGSDKLISICHNIRPHENNFFEKSLTKFYLKPFKKFMFMSSYVENELNYYKKDFTSSVRLLPIDTRHQTHLEKNSIKIDLGYESKDKIILFFGLIRPYKGLKNLLNAVKSTLSDSNELKLIIAGEAYEKLDDYKSIIDQYDINNKVTWISTFIDEQTIEKLMIISDLLVLPYNSASQSGVLAQAWQYNLPSIVTKVGGLPEYVDHGQSGYVVESNDTNELKQKIIHFFESDNYASMSKYISLNKEKFSWDNYVQGIMELADES
tara:strand:- start:15103 stop:16230 length:1128 start_codon:yes stop_codon:yes gene_type:complete